MNAAAIFAHHDKIAAAPAGSILIVSEPVEAQFIYSRTPPYSRTLAPGTWLRVKFVTGGLWCEVAVDGRVETVVINNRDFLALDIKEAK